MKKIITLIIICFALVQPAMAQRGCCSWHGGVAGCSSSGRTLCRDGTLSPSCTCATKTSINKYKQTKW